MSRHRDVRNMDYSDDYDGYDDVYGHSVDDDYYISPSHRQFMYNRENSGQAKVLDVHPMEQDIQEEDESEEELKLSETDRGKLESCLDNVKSTLAPLNMARHEVVRIIIDNKFEIEKVVNFILNMQSTKSMDRREKGDTYINHYSTFDSNQYKTINTHQKPSILPMLTLQNAHPQSRFSVNFNSKISRNNQSAAILRNTDSDNKIFNSGTDTVDGHHSISFLSKIKIGSSVSPNMASGSSTSKIGNFGAFKNSNDRLCLTEQSMQSGMKKKLINSNASTSSSALFLSKIKKPLDILDSEGNTTDSSCDISPKFLPINQHQHESLEKDNLVNEFSKTLASHLNLMNLNKEKVSQSDKTNTFLNRIRHKESANVLEQSTSQMFPKNANTQDISTDLSVLRLSEAKSLPAFREKIDNNNINIDLTIALRKTNDKIITPKSIPSKETFDLPFIVDCQLSNRKKASKTCVLDISKLASRKLPYSKNRPSNLGRILCLNYRIPKVKIRKKEILKWDPRLVRFDFSEPSPDDKIKKYLRSDL